MSRTFLLVGLTGGIATGKSTVSEMLRRLGAEVIDADVLARAVVEPGRPALAAVVNEFGRDLLRADGTLDRARLGAIVFADAEKRKRLEALTHPAIRELFAERVAELEARGFDGLVFFDAAVIVESGGYKALDRLVVVVTDEATEQARLTARDGIGREEALQRIRSQMPVADKAKLADYVIDNAGDRAATETEASWVYESLTRESHAARQLNGSTVPLVGLLFRNAAQYGQNPFDPRITARHYREACRSLSWVAYHPRRPSAALMIPDPGRDSRYAAGQRGADLTRLSCIVRTYPDFARLERALPGSATVTAHGKVVIGEADRRRNVVVVLLERDVPTELKRVGQIGQRVEAFGWTSDRDVVCLYDRPARSGSNGQVERALCGSLEKGAENETKFVGTARSMSVIRDMLNGKLEVIVGDASLRSVRRAEP